MADRTGRDPARSSAAAGPELAALQRALAGEHAAIWGYSTVGAALPESRRSAAADAQDAHRVVRDRLMGLITARGADPVATEGGYQLPFPVLSAVDAARLAVALEERTAADWAWVLDQATARSTRAWAVTVLGDTEVRAVGWRAEAGTTPVTTAFPGLPAR